MKHLRACSRLLVLVCLVSAGLTDLIVAATYYVNKNGNDTKNCTNNTTQACKTINRGASLLNAGDTLIVTGITGVSNVYAETLTNKPNGGSSWSSPVTIRGIPDANNNPIVIQPASGGRALTLTGSQEHYIIFDSIVFDGGNSPTTSVVWVESPANSIRFLNGEVRNNVVDCVSLFADSNEFISMKVHNCGTVLNQRPALSISGSHNSIDKCEVHDSGGSNLQVVGGAVDNVIRFSKIYSSLGGAGIELVPASSAVVHDNEIYNNFADGLVMDYGATANAVLRNLAYGNGGNGLRVGSGSTNAILINNITYLNVGAGIADSGTGTTRKADLPTP
jgi:parallel beta helix pectate lyase-like protein